MGQRPTALVAFGKRRKIGKQSSGLFPVRNPRRGFLGRAHGPQRTSTSPPETRPKRPPPFGGSGGGVSKLGATEPAPGAIAYGACAPFAAFLPPAAPVKAVERCSTPRKPLKRLERNFYVFPLQPGFLEKSPPGRYTFPEKSGILSYKKRNLRMAPGAAPAAGLRP